ncbi:MAG TPA: SprT-like domain-containing protein [Terriglobales bacterium]|nr:SprT-like domain-containing protein [Terriglobales bacterium]
MRQRLFEIFQQSYHELRLRTPVPELSIEFFAFTNITSTIRLRKGKLLVRLSDLLEGAPEAVLESISHILLAKIYRVPIVREHSTRYRRYVGSSEIRRKAHLIREIRGRKRISTPRGKMYNLEAIFEDLNARFFYGLLARPQITWSRDHCRTRLGHYDPARNTIVVSRVLDHPRVPRYVVEYIVYHEMLHLRHPVRLRGSRRSVHSHEFQADEKLFPRLDRAKQFLRQL